MMSVCNKTHKYIGIIFNRKCSSMPNFALAYLRLKPFNYFKYNMNHSIRSIYTASCLYKKFSFNLTDIGEGIREVVIKEWFVKVGDRVSQFDNICEVQSDKASVTITSRYDGVITKLYYDVDATAFVGQPLVDIESDIAPSEEVITDVVVPQGKSTPTNNNEPIESQQESSKKSLCLPSVRRLAKENNIDIAVIKGTGKDGRILKEDVLKFLQVPKVAQTKAVEEDFSISFDRVEPIRGFTKAMVKTMTASLNIPSFGYQDEIIISKISEIRKSFKRDAEHSGVKLTLLPFFVKAASNCLKKYPLLNSSVDEKCENIIYKSSHNIGIAMDTPAGLAVPVIKNVEKLSIIQIAKEINRLVISGKKGNFTTGDLSGGTFSISNIGAIGGTYASPVVLVPQVAIIALGASKVLPRFDKSNNVVAEEIMYVSASADHRIIDGATAARFINLLKKQIEEPYNLLLQT